MNRRIKKPPRVFYAALALLLGFSLRPAAAFAQEYTHQYPADRPYHEMSMYAYEFQQMNYPSGTFRLLEGDAVRLAYCADISIYDQPGTAYRAVPLDDHYAGSGVNTGKLRAIVQNAYPFISMQEMTARMAAGGVALHPDSVPCYEMVLISAAQQAVYHFTNNAQFTAHYVSGVTKSDYETLYKPLVWQYNEAYDNDSVIAAHADIKADVEAVYNWLVSLPEAPAPDAPAVQPGFKARVYASAGGYTLELSELFDGFAGYRDSLQVTAAQDGGQGETIPFSRFADLGDGRYQAALAAAELTCPLRVTLSGQAEYEDAVIYESETDDAGQQRSQPFIGLGKVPVPFAASLEAEVPRRPGSLTVTKTVSGGGADPSAAFSFTVTASLGGSPIPDGTYGDAAFTGGKARLSLKHGGSATIAGLPAGTEYLVEETGAGGYAVTASNAAGVIAAGQSVTAAFNNHRDGETPPDSETPPAAAGTPPPADPMLDATPKTGDAPFAAGGLVLAGLAAAGALGALAAGRRRR